MNVSANTKLNMVIGQPLSHTLSPVLHGYLYQQLAIDAVLLAFAVNDIQAAIHAVRALQVELVAVTMPYKTAVLDYVDDVSAEVKVLQAANTIIQRGGRLYAYNTDVAGIQIALSRINLQSPNVLILGAGGAARAAGYVMNQMQASISWCNRSREKAIQLAQQFGGNYITQAQALESAFDLIINTTPLGMHPNVNVSPLPHYPFHAKQVVFDMVYHPRQTQLLHDAQANQATIISGLDMFVGQGIRQVELWQNTQLDAEKIMNKMNKLLINHLS